MLLKSTQVVEIWNYVLGKATFKENELCLQQITEKENKPFWGFIIMSSVCSSAREQAFYARSYCLPQFLDNSYQVCGLQDNQNDGERI